MFILGFMNIHQVISILRTIWTWVCSHPLGLLAEIFIDSFWTSVFKKKKKIHAVMSENFSSPVCQQLDLVSWTTQLSMHSYVYIKSGQNIQECSVPQSTKTLQVSFFIQPAKTMKHQRCRNIQCVQYKRTMVNEA